MTCRTALATFVLLLFSGCGSETRQAAAQPKDGLSPETQRKIQAYQRGRNPWQQVSPDVLRLHRQVFELRHRLIASGQEVQTDASGFIQVLDDLALEVSVPATHVCGQELAIKITLHNRGRTPMRLVTWDDAFHVQVTHESGQILLVLPLRYFEAGHAPFPGPEDYRALAPGERFTRELKRYLPPNPPPGLYQVEVVYRTWQNETQEDTVQGSAGSLIQEVRFVLAPEAGGLRASLRLDESAGVDVKEAPTFLATLKNAGDQEITLMPWAGMLIFREVRTGKEIEFSQTNADLKGLPPRDARGYPVRLSYRTLGAGEELTLRIRPQATFDVAGQRTRFWQDLLVPGRRYEVRWHYYNYTGWFLEDGQFLELRNVWMGRLGSEPFGFTLGQGVEKTQPDDGSVR